MFVPGIVLFLTVFALNRIGEQGPQDLGPADGAAVTRAYRSRHDRRHHADIGREPSNGGGDAGEPLLEVDDLRTYVHDPHGNVRAVDGVSFDPATRRDARRSSASRAPASRSSSARS